VLQPKPARARHRVFVDGRVIGETSDQLETFRVRCGFRSVRIGSQGSVQEVNVPCGGVTRVQRR
jgi:hypothetical protein